MGDCLGREMMGNVVFAWLGCREQVRWWTGSGWCLRVFDRGFESGVWIGRSELGVWSLGEW